MNLINSTATEKTVLEKMQKTTLTMEISLLEAYLITVSLGKQSVNERMEYVKSLLNDLHYPTSEDALEVLLQQLNKDSNSVLNWEQWNNAMNEEFFKLGIRIDCLN